MRLIFDINNPVMRFLSRIFDILMLSLLTLLCSIPCITLGAAMISAFKVSQDIIYDTGSGVIKPFFKNFKNNFRQGIIVSIFGAVYIIIMISCLLWLFLTHTAGASLIPKIISLLIYMISTGFLIRLFAFIARYENTLKQHAYNALVLTFLNAGRTLALSALSLIPMGFYIFHPHLFLKIFPFWIAMYPGIWIFCSNYLLKSTFREMEDTYSQAA